MIMERIPYMDNENRNIRKNKFIMSDLFWLSLLVTIAGSYLSKAVPFLGLLGGVGLLVFLFSVAAEVYTTVKELDETGVPKNEQRSWWVIIGWWCIFIGDPLINGLFNFFFIAGILLLLVELKNITRFGGYLWARRGFMSFIFGFAVPLAIILIIMDIFRTSSSGKKK